VAGGEVPQVSLLEVIDKAAALGVKSSDADLALEDVSPLGLLVPVELTDHTVFETHVNTSKLLAGGELTNGCLARPTTLLDAHVRVGKGPTHVGNLAVVGAGRADEVGVLSLALPIAWAHDGSTLAIALCDSE
jgi:hypothetical protein